MEERGSGHEAILNSFIKIQEFDKPELKLYMENRIDYLTNKYTNLATTRVMQLIKF